MAVTFRAMVVEEIAEKKFIRGIKERSVADLPDGDVLIKVSYSSLNYKDGLSATGNRGVTRKFPHTPGIDAAGVVEQSGDSSFAPGDEVIVTSYDLGMNTDGGFGQYVRVPADWVVPLPKGLTLHESMMLGTAGFTAGMSIFSLAHCVEPDRGEVLVTGATGGVGSLAVAILAKLGYKVAAVTGKSDSEPFLLALGASRIIMRDDAVDTSGRPLLKTQWAGAVDTVGGDLLASAIKATDMHGVVTCCGNVRSPDLPINVFPFILRGVSLIGIDSQNCPMDHRQRVWQKLATEWKPQGLSNLCRDVSLDQLEPEIERILAGGQKGRVVVSLW